MLRPGLPCARKRVRQLEAYGGSRPGAVDELNDDFAERLTAAFEQRLERAKEACDARSNGGRGLRRRENKACREVGIWGWRQR